MVGRCAELCGQYHSMMNFEVRGVPDELYNAVPDAAAAGEPGTGRGLHQRRGADRDGLRRAVLAEATTTETFDTRRTADNIIAGGN